MTSAPMATAFFTTSIWFSRILSSRSSTNSGSVNMSIIRLSMPQSSAAHRNMARVEKQMAFLPFQSLTASSR